MPSLLLFLKELLRRELWWAEFWSGTTAVMWALFTIFSNDEMHAWPSMEVLFRIASPHVWQSVSLALGCLQLILLFLNRRWPRWVGSVVMCWFWTTLTLGVWVAQPWPTVAVYAGWCGVNIFSILRLPFKPPEMLHG